MGRNIIDIIIKADDKASAQLKAVTGNTKNLQAVLSQTATMMMAAGAAVAGAIGGIVYKTGMWADAMLDTSRALGITTEFLSGMEFALKRHGTDMSSFITGMRGLINAMGEARDGMAEYKEMFDRAGVSVIDANGKLRDAKDVFLDIADAIAKSESPTEAAGIAIDLLGRSALKIMPLLRTGSAGIKELTDKNRELGGELSTNTALAADRFGDALEDVKQSLKGVGLAIFDVYNDKLTKYAEKLSTETIPKTREWIQANEDLAKGVGIGSLAMIATGILAKLGIVAAANPQIAAIVVGIGLIAGALAKLSADYSEMQELSRKPIWKMSDEEMKRYALSIAGTNAEYAEMIENFKKLRAAHAQGGADAQEGIDLWGVQMPEAVEKSNKATQESLDILKMEAGVYKELLPLMTAYTGKALELDTRKEQVPGMPNTNMEEWNRSLAEFDVNGMDVARNMTSTFGGMFYAVGQDGVRASEVWEQAWRSAIGNIAAQLAQMAIWKIGGALLTGFLLNEGGEVTKGAGGFEVYGGTRGRDTVPALIGGGEAVIPSPTMDKLKRFLDGADGAGAGVVNVNPMFFSGSRADSFLAADFIQRRLDSQDRFIIRGSL